MPTKTADIASPIDAGLEKAKAALSTFAALCPDLSIFATVLAGRDPESPRGRLTVKPGQSTCTDGTTIFIRPDARLAGKPTDAEWSAIKAGLFHEVAHVVFDSFQATSEHERAAAIKNVTDGMDDSYRRDYLLRLIAEAGHSYKALSGVWHPAMPMLINALEDARVEARLFAAKPGTHKHLEASRVVIFDAPKAEIEALIGTAWIDRDTDSQAVIGTYLIGAGYAPEGRLNPEVCVALRNVERQVLLATTAENVQEVYSASFAVLSGLQAQGYLRTGTEADEPVGETPHEDGEPGGPAGESKCPHPKAMIVPCDSPACQGNCTVCGTHIVATGSPEPSDESSTPEPSDSGTEGEAGDGADAGEAGEGDEATGSDGSAEPTDEADEAEPTEATTEDADEATDAPTGESGTGDGAKSDTETEAVPTADDGSANEGVEAGKADVEDEGSKDEGMDLDALHEALHAAGGHDDREDAGSLDDADLGRALALDELGYGTDEDLVANVQSVKHARDGKVLSNMISTDRHVDVNVTEAERAIATVMPEMRKALALNGRTGFTPHQRSGRIDTRALYRTATGETRVFGRFSTPETRDYVFVIALDCSGSMGGCVSPMMRTQKALAYAEAEMLNRLGIPFVMFGYSGSGVGRSGYELMIQDIRSEGQQWDDAARDRLARLEAHACNLDGSTMQYARIRGRNMARNPKAEVVVLYHNDGGMPAENSRAEGAQIRREVRNARRNNVHFVGVGLGSTDAGEAGLDLVLCRNVADVRKVTNKIAESMGVRV